jgi:hypothetical protein
LHPNLKKIKMIKKLLTCVAVFATVSFFAQTGRTAKDSNVKPLIGTQFISTTNAKTAAISCDTIFNFNLSATSTSLTLYTATAGTACPTGGYVTGNNCYGMTQFANYTAGSQYSSLATPSVSGCFVMFYKNPTTGTGTKGVGTNTIGLRIYNGSMTTGPTPTAAPVVLGSTSAPISSVLATFSSTTNIGTYQFSFPTPVAVTPGAGYFTSVVLPTTLGDTAVIWIQKSATSTAAWETDAPGPWGDMKTDWGGTINFQLCVFPIMGCSGTVGIKENELQSLFNVVPNPSSGVVSLVASLTDLSFDYTVTNSIGQVVSSKKNVKGGSITEINMLDVPAGLYFVNVTAADKTITKKLIINK